MVQPGSRPSRSGHAVYGPHHSSSQEPTHPKVSSLRVRPGPNPDQQP
ncbi:unnamed protein product [Linum tenue]|uniref:Uncharacterized protein n=1 Tax=Linum tenue TaxID=586396 RepID=A0AAV0IAT9_9ROSI|nr:unnamed protein product [Linum tenue]